MEGEGRCKGRAALLLALGTLLGTAATGLAAEAPLALLDQRPPNLLDVAVGPAGAAVLLEARVDVRVEGALYVKVVPAPDGRNHAYMNGSATEDHRERLGGWTHRLLLAGADGSPLSRDAAGRPASGDFGFYTRNEPTPALLLSPGAYALRVRLDVPPDAAAAGTEPVEVQVRYHVALARAPSATAGGGAQQDPAVAAEWNLRLRHDPAAAEPSPHAALDAPPAGTDPEAAVPVPAALGLAALASAAWLARGRRAP